MQYFLYTVEKIFILYWYFIWLIVLSNKNSIGQSLVKLFVIYLVVLKSLICVCMCCIDGSHRHYQTQGLWVIGGLLSFLILEKVFPDEDSDPESKAACQRTEVSFMHCTLNQFSWCVFILEQCRSEAHGGAKARCWSYALYRLSHRNIYIQLVQLFIYFFYLTTNCSKCYLKYSSGTFSFWVLADDGKVCGFTGPLTGRSCFVTNDPSVVNICKAVILSLMLNFWKKLISP